MSRCRQALVDCSRGFISKLLLVLVSVKPESTVSGLLIGKRDRETLYSRNGIQANGSIIEMSRQEEGNTQFYVDQLSGSGASNINFVPILTQNGI
jgi:hypothetical protein